MVGIYCEKKSVLKRIVNFTIRIVGIKRTEYLIYLFPKPFIKNDKNFWQNNLPYVAKHSRGKTYVFRVETGYSLESFCGCTACL